MERVPLVRLPSQRTNNSRKGTRQIKGILEISNRNQLGKFHDRNWLEFPNAMTRKDRLSPPVMLPSKRTNRNRENAIRLGTHDAHRETDQGSPLEAAICNSPWGESQAESKIPISFSETSESKSK